MSLDSAVTYAKILNHLIKDPSLNALAGVKLQTAFYTGLKKHLSKKSVKTLSIDDQLRLLEALPPVEGDQYSSQRSLHYIILNEMVSPSATLVEKWEALDKDQVMTIVARCMELSKARDINNKLRGCLNYIRTH